MSEEFETKTLLHLNNIDKSRSGALLMTFYKMLNRQPDLCLYFQDVLIS